MADVVPDTVVDGRYKVIRLLGSGGMADVFCAQDLQLGRNVALKLLHPRFAQDDEFVERFRREAQSAAGLQHPNVVGVYDRGQWDGTWYIAMEFLPGQSLKDVILTEAPLAPLRATEIAIQILKAARFAHRRGVIHRDLKPHNVIVDEEDRIKVADFGIARAGASDMTETGSILGTAQYLSPEQAQGHAVSARSDLYSVGVILYEMLTARLPFEAESAVSIAVKHVTETPPSPRTVNPSVPPELDAVVMWALEKSPERRPPDAEAMLSALEQARDHMAAESNGPSESTTRFLPVPPPPPPPVVPVVVAEPYPEDPYPPLEDEERRPLWPWLVALLVLLLVGGGVAAYLLTRPQKIVVPNVIQLKQDVAQTRLQNEGFKVSVIPRTSDRPKDEVISEIPLPGTKLPKGETVTLTVSAGPGQGSIPDVSNLTVAAARKALKRAGFRTRVTEDTSDTVPAGKVISSQPGPGSQIDKGSVVLITASTGPPLVVVPDVTGKSEADARAQLEADGFVVNSAEQDSTKPKGTVLTESPAGGTKLRKGATVSIVVAKEGQIAIPDVTGKTTQKAVNLLTAQGFQPEIKTRTVTTPDQDGKVITQTPKGQAKKGTKITITVGKFSANPNPGEPTTTTSTTPTTPTTTTP